MYKIYVNYETTGEMLSRIANAIDDLVMRDCNFVGAEYSIERDDYLYIEDEYKTHLANAEHLMYVVESIIDNRD